jgi:hypothetical protein
MARYTINAPGKIASPLATSAYEGYSCVCNASRAVWSGDEVWMISVYGKTPIVKSLSERSDGVLSAG